MRQRRGFRYVLAGGGKAPPDSRGDLRKLFKGDPRGREVCGAVPFYEVSWVVLRFAGRPRFAGHERDHQAKCRRFPVARVRLRFAADMVWIGGARRRVHRIAAFGERDKSGVRTRPGATKGAPRAELPTIATE